MFFAPAERLRGELSPPPDKSISHRAAIVGAMGDEPVAVRGYLEAADTRSTLAADGATTVSEPHISRDHTERMLAAAGVTIHRNGRHVTVTNCDELVHERIDVPGDASSAAFLVAAGLLVPHSRLLLRDVNVNW